MQQISLHGVDVQVEIWPIDWWLMMRKGMWWFFHWHSMSHSLLYQLFFEILVCKFFRTEETICCLSESGMCSHSCLIQDLLYFKIHNANIFVWQDRSAGGLFMAPRLLFHRHAVAKHAECGYCLAAIIKTRLEKESILLAAYRTANQHNCAFRNVQRTNVSP